MSLVRIDHTSLEPIASYSDRYTVSIKNWYATGESEGSIQQLLQTAWEEQAWIQCDCNNEAPPVMHVRRTRSGFYLVRMRKHGNHTEDCPFSSRPFSLAADSSTDTSSTHRLPFLKNLMLNLLHESHLNHLSFNVSGYPVPIKFQYERLRQAAERIRLRDGTPLSEVLVTHPNGLFRLKKQLAEKGDVTDTVSQDNSGFLFMMADQVAKDAVHVVSSGHSYKVPVYGPLYAEQSDHPGPWIGLIEINRVAHANGAFEGLSGYFMPAASKAILCPITPEEQRTVDIIKGLQMKAKQKNSHIQCIKYLPDEPQYAQGLRFQLNRRETQVDIAIVMSDEDRDALPQGVMYHYHTQDGTTHPTEPYFIQMIEKRFLK